MRSRRAKKRATVASIESPDARAALAAAAAAPEAETVFATLEWWREEVEVTVAPAAVAEAVDSLFSPPAAQVAVATVPSDGEDSGYDSDVPRILSGSPTVSPWQQQGPPARTASASSLQWLNGSLVRVAEHSAPLPVLPRVAPERAPLHYSWEAPRPQPPSSVGLFVGAGRRGLWSLTRARPGSPPRAASWEADIGAALSALTEAADELQSVEAQLSSSVPASEPEWIRVRSAAPNAVPTLSRPVVRMLTPPPTLVEDYQPLARYVAFLCLF